MHLAVMVLCMIVGCTNFIFDKYMIIIFYYGTDSAVEKVMRGSDTF